jgi:isopentenyl diphosphate isomerase/L-lactate dehydrogenase-like FMN-dependent dehydrogenase
MTRISSTTGTSQTEELEMTTVMTEQEWREKMQSLQRDATAEGMSALIRDVMAAPHDYGSVCVAIGGLAAAAARAADREPHGGITGFQAGAIFWEFVRAWGVFPDGPKRMVSYGEMLYPQYATKFEPTITAEVWKWLKDEAQRKLHEAGDDAHGEVRAHWESIVRGGVPFGYRVTDED